MVRGSYSIPENQTLFIDRNNLSAVESIRDLGVTVDSQINFSKHIQESGFSKANSRVYLLLKSFKSCSINLMLFAFKVYVLPLLDYCSPPLQIM